MVLKVYADSAYRGPKLCAALDVIGWKGELEAVEKPPDIKGVNVIFRRWIVERTFGWLGR